MRGPSLDRFRWEDPLASYFSFCFRVLGGLAKSWTWTAADFHFPEPPGIAGLNQTTFRLKRLTVCFV